LNAQEYALFDRLRTLRRNLPSSKVPVYAVFTNEHLAAMVKKPPAAAGDLLALTGVGEARVKQYGDSFIKLFQELSAGADAKGG
jgi:ATP-dependent DNA helicase RecQ